MKSDRELFNISTNDQETFRVEVVLESAQSELEILSKLLKNIKDEISRQFRVPVSRLKYQRIIDKKVSPDGIKTSLELFLQKESKGKPVLKFCSMSLANGQTIDNMILMADVHPQDEDGSEYTREKLRAVMSETGIIDRFIIDSVLEDIITKLSDTRQTVEDMVLAKGLLPEIGEDSRLEFKFSIHPDKSSVKQFTGSRKAKPGDVLCVKHPRKTGSAPGVDLFGNELKPISGRDFNLIAGNGTKLSSDGSKIIADIEGVAVVKKDDKKVSSLGLSQAFPREVQLRIDPLTVIESSRTVEIVTKDSVEIQGSLKRNSNIISEGDVFVLGEVENDSKIHSTGGIYVEGNVNSGSLISSKEIFAGGAVTDSTLSAKGMVRVEGALRNSNIYGENVEVDRLINSTVVAAKQIVVRSIEADEAGLLSEIQVGIKQYQTMKVKENEEFLDYLKDDLGKMKGFFGEKMVGDVSYANLEMILLKVAKKLSKQNMDTEKWEATKKLLESVPSLKMMIVEKHQENEELKERIEKQEEMPGVVIVKEKIECPVRIEINSIRTDMASGESGTYIIKDGSIVREE